MPTRATVHSAAPLVPHPLSLRGLREAAAGCRACPLWERGTQTVFGEGLRRARLMLVGEQPGDAEDREGRPFVGPAGHLLDRALEAAGIARGDAYVTNAVKHFKWVPMGKRRLHQKPSAREIQACLPWLQAEMALIRPQVVVALGATATQALLGNAVKVTRDRGRILPSPLAPHTLVTIHPSAILRAPTDEERHRAMADFTRDLAQVRALLD